MLSPEVVKELTDEIGKPERGRVCEILEATIQDCVKYLTNLFHDLFGKDPDRCDILNSVLWAIESKISSGTGEYADDPSELCFISTEMMGGIYTYKRMNDVDLAKACKDDNIVALYVRDMRKIPACTPKNVPKKKGKSLSWVDRMLSTQPEISPFTGKPTLSLLGGK